LRVAVYHSNDDVRLEQLPRPTIGPGELLMRVEASGVCGSDVMEWYRRPKAPIVLGHEVAGIVEEVGAGIDEFKVGDRIVTTHHVPCMTCRYCSTDRHAVCESLRTTSFDPGGFAEYVRLPAVNVERGTFIVPEDVTFEEASFVEPLACVVRALRLSRMGAGDSVVVLGAGISGIMMIQMARVLGAGRIIATDIAPERLELARRFGADLALRGDAPDVAEQILAANDGMGIEQVLVCTGALPVAEQALQVADLGGTVLYFAPLDPGQALTLDMNELWKRGVNLVHSYAGPPADMRAALDLIAAGKVDVASMITHRLPLSDTAEAFRLMLTAGNSLKIIIEPQK
jgi:L-iditol 2-dehydrogenase